MNAYTPRPGEPVKQDRDHPNPNAPKQLTIDQAVELAFKHRNDPIQNQDEVREVILAEIERLEELDSFEARFTVPIIQGLADDLYRPNLNNAVVG